MTSRRGAWAGLVLVLAVGCEGRFGRGQRDIVVWVGEEPIRKAELEAYFADNLLAVGEGEPLGDVDPVVASRLLDSLVDERLLLLEAERRGIEATDVEIAVAVDEADEGSGHATPTPQVEARVRRHLLIDKLQAQLQESLPAVTDEEVAEWAVNERPRLLQSRPVDFRALQLPSLAVARSVREEVRRGRVSFEEAVVAHEPSPGQTVRTRVSWDELPSEVQQAVEGLGAGGVSEPVELHGRVYLFEIVARYDDAAALAAELRTLARDDLESRRRQEALGNLLRELRERTEIQIRSSSLPFSYSP